MVFKFITKRFSRHRPANDGGNRRKEGTVLRVVNKNQAPSASSQTSSSTAVTANTASGSETLTKAGNGKVDAVSARKAIEIVKKYWAAFHAKDTKALMLQCDEHAVVNFVDTQVEMPLSQYVEIWQDTLESFPDFTLEMSTDKISKSDCRMDAKTGDIIVPVHNVRATGTHTGKPYAFGPFPAIPAKGIYVRDVVTNTNHMHIDVTASKLTFVKVTTDGAGNESGPAYFYEQIGGVLF